MKAAMEDARSAMQSRKSSCDSDSFSFGKSFPEILNLVQ